MAVKPVIGVPGVGIRVVAAEVITSSCVIVSDEIGMHIVDSVIHYGCGNIVASNFKVPLMLEERICRICFWWQIYQIFHF